jgi:hypothetical protein
MPKQNRVTPFGDLIADPARGMWMGNRGRLHDSEQRIVRHHAGQRWIFCQLQFKNVHRQVMAPGRYTELFFLDEATALAAGHRPCAECSRPRFNEFRRWWAAANPELAGKESPTAASIDAVLHAERISPKNEKHTYLEMLCNLPDGVMIAGESSDHAYLVHAGGLLRWAPGGYVDRIAGDSHWAVRVLTPRSVVRAIRLGYCPQVHPSAFR